MFVKTTVPNVVAGDRCYAAGSVIEVDEVRGKRLTDDKAAVPDDGPASEPPAAAEDGPKKADAKADPKAAAK